RPHAAAAERPVHAGRGRPAADRQLRADQHADGRDGLHGPLPHDHRGGDLVLAPGGNMTPLARVVLPAGAIVLFTLCSATAFDTPPPDRGAWLRDRLSAAAPGATVDVPPGRYIGPFTIDRPVTLRGHGGVVLVGEGTGHVISVRAAD